MSCQSYDKLVRYNINIISHLDYMCCLSILVLYLIQDSWKRVQYCLNSGQHSSQSKRLIFLISYKYLYILRTVAILGQFGLAGQGIQKTIYSCVMRKDILMTLTNEYSLPQKQNQYIYAQQSKEILSLSSYSPFEASALPSTTTLVFRYSCSQVFIFACYTFLQQPQYYKHDQIVGFICRMQFKDTITQHDISIVVVIVGGHEMIFKGAQGVYNFVFSSHVRSLCFMT